MTFRGRVRNGQIVFDEPVPLPEGAEVAVEVVGSLGAVSTDVSTTLIDDWADFVGKLDLPADFAAQHDHYIHGTRKR